MTVRDRVEKLLKEIPQTRENDNLLIAYFFKDEYGTQNMLDVALMTKSNIYESVRRERAKIQSTNPMLRPNAEVYEARLKKETKVREEMRGF